MYMIDPPDTAEEVACATEDTSVVSRCKFSSYILSVMITHKIIHVVYNSL